MIMQKYSVDNIAVTWQLIKYSSVNGINNNFSLLIGMYLKTVKFHLT